MLYKHSNPISRDIEQLEGKISRVSRSSVNTQNVFKNITGTSSGGSSGGSANKKVVNVSDATYSDLGSESVILFDTSSNDISFILQLNSNGRILTLKKVSDNNELTISSLTGNIDGETEQIIKFQSSIQIVGDGTNWWII